MKKTQAFLVIGFIVAAALAIGFFMQKEDEKNSRMKAESMLSSVMKEKEDLAIKMNEKLQEKERLITYLSASLYKEKTIKLKLAENLERSGRRFLAAAPKKPVEIELEKIVISSLLEAEGKVLAVDKQNDLIVINLGSMNNLKSGDKLSVYRGDSFIASAELVKVQNRISAAAILPGDSSKDLKVEVNDTVK
ncbi:MAG: hypothetical protein NTX47_06185 [Candidatus Omnitrophica bacterium]|nr:hypothetical protein [Candidatus Omnitrophota bacterium]